MAHMAQVKRNEGKRKRDEAKVRKDFWPKLRRVLGRIPFAGELLAAYYCALDPQTPLAAKAILMGALAYFIMPVDMVPDFIALLGFTDDAAVLFMAMRQVRKHIQPAHRERAQAYLEKV
jgi:uncharacterized membrane protein YkvA (DUF1232 family)